MPELDQSQLKVSPLGEVSKFLSAHENFKNAFISSSIPQACKDEPCVLGVDEAGRGPVLGPMVYGIAFCPIESNKELVDLGCADSKELTEEKRDIIFANMNTKESSNSCIGWSVEVISPSVISANMLRRTKYSLNEISMDSAIGLIKRAADEGVNIAEVYVDTVGPPEKYQAKLSNIFPYYKITVAKKADSTYPIVSAASICAKVTRDHALKLWRFPEGLKLSHETYGSGYPGDPDTKRFLSENADLVFGYPNLVRFSWSTAETALNGHAYDVEFDDIDDTKQEYEGEQITKFFKGKTIKGQIKRERHQFFKRRFLGKVEF